VESSRRITSPILTLLQRPSAVLRVPQRAASNLNERIYKKLSLTKSARIVHPLDAEGRRSDWLVSSLLGFFAVLFVVWGSTHAYEMLHTVSLDDLRQLLLAGGATYLRVNIALVIAALWTIPVGVAIGSNPRLAPILQPITQLIASIPASAFFPVMMLMMFQWGVGLGIGSIALMLLGTQWYILFNVIAGAMAIPSDLKEAAKVYRFTTYQRWTKLILPGIFPYLITGMVTASGGAWNASILAEYGLLGNRTFQTVGLGAQITAALNSNNLSTLLLATILMAAIVVTTNRLVWRRLYKLAETRYKLEG
jgi:NitT/TauT family transport system permease protein